jgi:membrane protease YdiL (CAAX protease family)
MNHSLKNRDWLAVAIALTLPSLVTWAYFIWLDGAAAGAVQTAFGVGKTIQFLLPAFWVLLIRRERPEIARPAAWSLSVGVLFALVVAAGMAILYVLWFEPAGLLAGLPDLVQAKLKSFGVHSLAAYIGFALFYSAIHSLLEEYYWRWFVFGQLARGCRLPIAITIASVGFAAHHVLVLGHYFGWASPLTWLFSAAVAIGGAFWCWLYHRSNSLAAPWLSHAFVDAAIFTIGYTLLP